MNSENISKSYLGKQFDTPNFNYSMSQGLCNFETIIGNNDMLALWNKISLKHKCELWAGEYKSKLTFYHRIWIW